MQMRTRCHSSNTHLDANATLHARIRLDAQCASASCAALPDLCPDSLARFENGVRVAPALTQGARLLGDAFRT